jgi:hypothetical protein
MAQNNFDGTVVLEQGTGSAATPGEGYIVFGSATTGPRIYAGTGTPDGVVTAPAGSIWLRTDTPGIYQNEAGSTGWSVVTQTT